MQGEHRASSGSTILRDVLDLLVDLKQTPAGLVIHDQITRLLADCETEQHKTEQNYLDLVTVLLEAYSRDPNSENVMRVTARLIQLRSTSRMTPAAITALREDLLVNNPTPPEPKTAGGQEYDTIMSGLSRRAPADKHRKSAATAASAEDADPQEKTPHPSRKDSTVSPATSVRTRAREKKMQQILADEESRSALPAERRVNTAYRLQLDRKRDEIDMLQETLVSKMADAIHQNKEFGTLLEIERISVR